MMMTMAQRRCCVSVLTALALLLVAVVAQCQGDPFLTARQAERFLSRQRRAYNVFEEAKQGNLERECVEEFCNKEEAREVFENDPETNYFYPKYLDCLSEHHITEDDPHDNWRASSVSSVLRTCVTALPNQCIPSPCSRASSLTCIDQQGDYACICHVGWTGKNCTQDINECDKNNGRCGHECMNLPGTRRCRCRRGYLLQSDHMSCQDEDECSLGQGICGQATCVNTEGSFHCSCLRGYVFNEMNQTCDDVNECLDNSGCAQLCVNTEGSYACRCDGRSGFQLGNDLHQCKPIIQLFNERVQKNAEWMCTNPHFITKPTFLLRFKLRQIKREVMEFGLRTFDAEGLVLYVERGRSRDPNERMVLALRNGSLEVQLQMSESMIVTTGGKPINDGAWHTVSVERPTGKIIVKLSGEEVININTHSADVGSVSSDILISIAGLPTDEHTLMKPLNVHLDACMRDWSWLDQDTSWIKEETSSDNMRQCFSSVERGAYFPGTGMAYFNRSFLSPEDGDSWELTVELSIRPAGDTGIIFALASHQNDEVPLSVSLEHTARNEYVQPTQYVQVALGDVVAARLEVAELTSMQSPTWQSVAVRVSATALTLSVDGAEVTGTEELLLPRLAALQEQLSRPVAKFFGGLPDSVPLRVTPVTAFFQGCMRDVRLNGLRVELDTADSLSPGVTSHSCPLFHSEMPIYSN
uniref:Vitamin K-dependent protein S n=1 Tax=Petromyzon marinus TaxID=7757 RepID=A0AAJ7U108_PETMA|nr:vitamin K-dependent protein S-like [Petromyzon marinus]